MAGKRKKSGHNAGTMSIIFIVLVFVAVMSIQIYKLKEKDKLLAEREENLMQQMTEEMLREEELEELDLYTRSMEYIKDMANKLGLVGSSLFKKEYKKAMENKLLINFDCVSDGDNILFSVSKTAQKEYMEKVATAFEAEDKTIMVEKGEKVFYPSDQVQFKCNVAVAALKHKKIIGYYMDRIHTPKDTVFYERNIELLSDGAVKFVDMV